MQNGMRIPQAVPVMNQNIFGRVAPHRHLRLFPYHPRICPRLFFSQAMMIRNTGPEAAHKFVDFVNASPTPFHAVQTASARLESAGFQKAGGVSCPPFIPCLTVWRM